MEKLAQQDIDYHQEQALAHLTMLDNDNEKAVLKQLASYCEVVRNACASSEPHLIANFLRELAAEYHGFYNNHKVIIDDPALRNARLALSLAVRQVIRNGLALLGVSAPEQM
jgi:arginyl-tRNA synthetase